MPSDQNPKLTKAAVFWLLALLLLAAPYQTGLFFQREWLYTQVFVALLLVLAVFTRLKKLCFFSCRLDFAALGLLTAYLAGAARAVDARSAVAEVLKLISFLAVYWLTAYGGWSRRDLKVLLSFIFWGGFGVALLGVFTALGIYQAAGGYVAGRIYSTFQYPNTLAAFLGFMLLLGVFLWRESKARWRLLYLPALYVIVLCLIGTGSRGGLGALILALPWLFWILPPEVRKDYFYRLLFAFGLGIPAAAGFLQYLGSSNSTAAWIVSAGGLVLAGLAGGLPERLQRLEIRQLLWPGALGVLLAASLVLAFRPGTLNPLSRLGTASLQLHTFQERLTYYRDALKMVSLSPVAGYGGGGWALYPRYQSYPYWVSDPHSQLVKAAVESGLPGLAFYLAWWLSVGRAAWRRARQGDGMSAVLFSGLLLIAVHSLIDFDLSFGAMGFLVWCSAGVVAARDLEYKAGWNRAGYLTAAVLLLAGALGLAAVSISFLQAAEYEGRAESYLQRGQAAQALQQLELARVRDPLSSGYPAKEAELYFDSPGVRDLAKARDFILISLRLDSADLNIKGLASRILAANGELKQAAALAEDRLSFQTLHGESYLELAKFYQSLASAAEGQGQRELAKYFLLQGSGLAGRLQSRLDKVPDRAAALWVGGKPAVPAELTQKSTELAALASKIN